MTLLSLETFRGCITGLAVGDALGYPAEFRRRAQILREIGPEGITDFLRIKDARFSRPIIMGTDHPPGTYTDDTQMSLAVAEALIAAGQSDLDTLMNQMGRNFAAWAHSEDNNRSPGSACMTGCQNLRMGKPWRSSGVADSKGCGAAMRVAPIGLYYSDVVRLVEVAKASSLPTHGHHAALQSAAAGALMVHWAARGVGPKDIFDRVMKTLSGVSPDFDLCMGKVPGMLETPPEVALTATGLGEGWVAEEAVASAFYCFWRHPDDYSAAVLMGVNTDGDSDSIACIAGSILGARLGYDKIPRRWSQSVENATMLDGVAARLWQASQN